MATALKVLTACVVHNSIPSDSVDKGYTMTIKSTILTGCIVHNSIRQSDNMYDRAQYGYSISGTYWL